MTCSLKTDNPARTGALGLIGAALLGFLIARAFFAPVCAAEAVTGEHLYRTGVDLMEKSRYLEALDLFSEARRMLEADGKRDTRLFSDLLYAIASTKIRGRLHQSFPALYVKTALKEIEQANSLREKLSDAPARQLAEGYFLEGFIHQRFFKRKREAREIFQRAIKVDPGFAPAKRALSGMLSD